MCLSRKFTVSVSCVYQVEAVATALTEADISKETTRIALTKVLSRGLRALPDADRLKK